MRISIHRPAVTGAVLVLLSACGGGGNAVSGTAPPSPGPVPSPTPGTPSPTPSNVPKDYQLAYTSPARGIVTVPASSLDSAGVVRSTAQPLLTAPIYDGEWSNGVLSNSRPHSLAFLDGNTWRLISLRIGSAQGVSNIGVTESRTVCPNAGTYPFVDYAAPGNSVIGYFVAGSDGSCDTGDDVFTAFRLGSAGVTNFGLLPSLRQFRDGNGALTGLLAQVGTELRLYAPGASTFTTVATGISGFALSAASFARTTSSAWMRWSNGSVRAIYRIDANGAVSSPLYSVPTADTLSLGFADPNAMYVSHRPSGTGSDEIVRVPFGGGSSSVLATVTGSTQVVAATANSLLIRQFNGDTSTTPASDRFLVLAKTGGTPVAVGSTIADSSTVGVLTAPVVTSNNQFLLNRYTDSGGIMATAVLVDERGQVSETVPRSEWFGALAGDQDFSRQITSTAAKAARVESYTGSYSGTGHQGGSIVIRDFASGTRAAVAQVNAAGLLYSGSFALPADFAVFETQDGSNTDIFAFDLDRNSFTQVTDTPGVREGRP